MNKLLVIIFAVIFSTTSLASLESRLGGRAVYDTELDITWLADANLAKSEIFGISGINIDGTMSWDTAYYQWLPALNTYLGPGYLGFNDWRLPPTVQPDESCSKPNHELFGDIGNYCIGSELGHLFYIELSGLPGQSIVNSGDPDLSLFTNLDVFAGFWSATLIPDKVYAGGELQDWVYYFNFTQSPTFAGDTSMGDRTIPDFWVPWIVRDGDVSVTAVPPTAPILTSPVNGLTGIDTTVTFSWEVSTDADGDSLQYSLTVCETSDFTGCTPVVVAGKDFSRVLAGLGGGTGILLLTGLVLPNVRSRRRKWAYGVCLVAIAVLITACGGGGGGSQDDTSQNQAVTGLNSGTEYFWKVTATDFIFNTDSEVRNFITQ